MCILSFLRTVSKRKILQNAFVIDTSRAGPNDPHPLKFVPLCNALPLSVAWAFWLTSNEENVSLDSKKFSFLKDCAYHLGVHLLSRTCFKKSWLPRSERIYGEAQAVKNRRRIPANNQWEAEVLSPTTHEALNPAKSHMNELRSRLSSNPGFGWFFSSSPQFPWKLTRDPEPDIPTILLLTNGDYETTTVYGFFLTFYFEIIIYS